MKVIVVDDERNARENLQIKLGQIPQISAVELFGDPQEAVGYAKTNPVDVAFLDIEMPEMCGIETAMRLKDANPKINIVFVTGYAQYAVEAFEKEASDYLLKPATVERIEAALTRLRNPVLPSYARVRVQTFGNFEAFADDKPILFKHEKTKELFAYLVHRKGAMLSNNEIMAVIWENKEDTPSLKSYFRILTSDLTGTFERLGFRDIIIKKRGQLGITADKIACDYYDFFKGIPYAVNSYRKEYMAQYTWAEFTNACLSD